MNLMSLPGTIVNGVNNGVSMIDNFFADKDNTPFDQASKLNSWQPTNAALDARHGLPKKDNFRAQTAEDRARLLPLTDPITVGFKLMLDWSKDYGLLCDDDITPNQAMTTKNNSAVAYLFRIGEDNRAMVLQRWIKNLKDLIVLYDFLFLHVEGLDLIQNRKPGHVFTEDEKINIVIRETVDLRIQSLINTYNWIWYDDIRGVEVLPSNLRKFDAFIMVFDVNYYSTLLYDIDQKALNTIDKEDKKYQRSEYMEGQSDMDGKLDRGEITQKEYDRYFKKVDKVDAYTDKLLAEDTARFNDLIGNIKGSANERNVLPTKAKVASLILFDVENKTDIKNVQNNLNQHIGFNHMVYEFKSMQIDVTESGKGFTGNVSNEPNSEFVRNNITFNFKRAFASGDFYNTFAFPTKTGDYNASPADLIAMSTIQTALEREQKIVDSINNGDEIDLDGVEVEGKSPKAPKDKFKIKVDWKKTGNFLKGVAIQAGKKLGKEIWERQKNKILSQNSVIGNLLNIFATQSPERMMIELINNNVGYKVQNVVSKNISLMTDVLPTKDDILMTKVGGNNAGSLSNGASLLNNNISNDGINGGTNGEKAGNSPQMTENNTYSGSTAQDNPVYNGGLNVYNGNGF